MKLAIIAAGEGSRLRGEGIEIPKPLVKICGEPMVHRIIRIAGENGFSSVECIINEESPLLKEYLTKTSFGIPVNLTVRSTKSSMHSLFVLSELLTGEFFCLTTADTIFSRKEFRDFIAFSKNETRADGILAVTNFIDDEKPLCLRMNETMEILEFSDRSEGYEWATGGLYYLSPRIFRMKSSAVTNEISRLRNFLRLLLENKYLLKSYPFTKIIDVDHTKDILEAEKFLIEELRSEKTGSPGSEDSS